MDFYNPFLCKVESMKMVRSTELDMATGARSTATPFFTNYGHCK